MALIHQYIERETNKIETEHLCSDRVIRFIYSSMRENVPAVFRAVTGRRMSSLLGFFSYDFLINRHLKNRSRFLQTCGIDLSECLDPPSILNTPRKIFERKIRYWECRPMIEDPRSIVSPADSKILLGSLSASSLLFLKGKFFDYEELLGKDKRAWLNAFREGDYVICRLTPEKYHYNHTPVAGKVLDFYQIDGSYHSCNPNAVISILTPFSKNKRIVTIIDTDVPNGTKAGLVAMIEVVAMMVGGITQCYSESFYDNPTVIVPGMFIKKGCPKSLYHPGSSTDIVLFQRDRVEFCQDLIRNRLNSSVLSRFTSGFGHPLVETDLKVRSTIGWAVV
ncbi:MAG: phosphatidylserine decarboxylase [Syntrophales bacterium]|nr:phosphatidylserine decarboxylase [Syntrophales bacterium]